MPDKTYIKVSAIYKKLKEAEASHRVLYISGAVGFGKTAAVKYFFRRRPYLYLSGEQGYLEEKPDIEQIKEKIIVIDDVSWITDPESRAYIIHLVEASQKQMVLIGRSRVPSWLGMIAVEQEFLLADERDLALSEREIEKALEDSQIRLTETEMKELMEFTRGHALTLRYLVHHLKGGIPYSKVIEEEVRTDLYYFFDHAFYEKWDVEIREVLLAVCQYPTFTVELAEMLTGNSRIPYLLDKALSLGSFLTRNGDGTYKCRYALRYFLWWKQSVTYTKEQMKENYERAALYYEIHNQIELALKYYECAGNYQKVSGLLRKNAENHPGTGHFFETREYYYKLPKEEVCKSPILMSGMSMLYAITLQPEKSDEWYEELKRYEEKALKGSPEQKEARVRLAYLDIALPHKGIHGIIGILKNTAILCKNKNVKLPEFSVTSNMPSIMNGGLDFCEWSRNDKELAVLMKKPIEVVLGKYGVGLVNIALAESGFEKGTMDTYEVMTRLNTGYVMADAGGRIEMCFAVAGLLARLHVSQGQPKAAQEGMDSFRKKVVLEGAGQLLTHVDTLNMWLQLLQGKPDIARDWLTQAPDENVAFCILDRYKYIHKVRCLIALRKYEEAAGLIERLNLYFTKYERNYLWMENQTLKAILQYRIGNAEWEKTLNGTLCKMEHYHFIRIAAQEGVALKPLLDKLTNYTISKDFYNLLCREVDRTARYYPNYLGEEKELKEPLTEMEESVLKLLCDNQSSEQICSLCNIAYSTLKSHKRNIYRKLGVKNRKEAEIAAVRLDIYEM